MSRFRPRHGAAAALALALCVAAPPGPAGAEEAAARPLPFSDDLPPPPPLPEPLDRHLRAALSGFDGERVALRWDWSAEEQLEDFEPFVPVRVTVRGGFAWKAGRLEARGTAGLRLRLGMLSDLRISVPAKLHDPHDLGIAMVSPDTSDESVLCHLQDRVFTRFDAAAGNTNMINKIGGIPASAPGHVEFRYVARSKPPALAKGVDVQLDVVRSGPQTTFTITPDGEEPVKLAGKDTDTPYTRLVPGLYVAGSAADFGPLEVEGRIDPAWCREHDVLPHVASDLLHPGNRFKGAERRAAELVERFARQDPAAEADPKKTVQPAQVAALVGDEKLALVIRIRAAEALTERGAAGDVAANVAALLDAKEQPVRVLAWQMLRPELPWHFGYEPDGEPAARREASLLVADYFRHREDELAQGKVFVDGHWYTPSRADAIREAWPDAWDLRTPRVRLRTNLPREWADWYLAALEAGYAELVRTVGREPPPEKLPLSVLVFRTDEDFQAFCAANGYADKAAWRRFADVDRNAAFVAFKKQDAPHWALNLLAKLYLRAATGQPWPTWIEEGRAAWFGNAEYQTAAWDGRTLEVGRVGRGGALTLLAAAVMQGRAWTTEDFLGKDPRRLEGQELRIWYAHAWALHHFLMEVAPERLRQRFADWQQVMDRLDPSPRDVDAVGKSQFLAWFRADLPELDETFRAWARGL